jgi:hypothetical protein
MTIKDDLSLFYAVKSKVIISRPDLSSLGECIRQEGLLQPIGVTERFVFGERRLRAVKDIPKRKTIVAQVVDVTSTSSDGTMGRKPFYSIPWAFRVSLFCLETTLVDILLLLWQ